MILIDTPIWIDHLGLPDPRVFARLEAGVVLMHPFVLGEILLGNLRDRNGVRETLSAMKMAPQASPEDVLQMIDRHGLAGSGIGYVDAHLVATTLLVPKATFWTRDKRLHAVAVRLGVAADIA